MNDYLALLKVLTEARVDFVVVGGTAAVLHGAATATYDLDIAMTFSVENSSRLLSAMAPLHPRYSHTTEQRPVILTAEELATFRNLYLLTDLGRLDVLGSLPPIAHLDRVFASAELMDVGGLIVKVVALEVLLEVKADMGRPKDKQVEVELRALAAARSRRQE